MINLESLPELLTTKDLVNLGLFSSIDQSYLARLNGNSPDWIKVGRKIFFPKTKVLEFIESRIQSGSTPRNREFQQGNK